VTESGRWTRPRSDEDGEPNEDEESDRGEQPHPLAEVAPPATVEEAPPATVDRRADLAITLCITMLGLAVMYLARYIRHGAIDDPIGPGGFATVLGAFLTAVGLILLVRRLALWRRSVDGKVYADGGEGDEPDLPVSGIRPFVMLAVGFGWAFMLPRIGFLVTTSLACVAGLFAMRTRSVVKLVLVPIGFSLFTWVLFTRLSGLRFPAGPVDLFFATLIPRLG
jgi:putative tricarboxylic transport membrane protein